MRIKSYFAKSVDEAMIQARAELGNDALLLNPRKSEGGKPENYEVVFGTVEAVSPPALPQVRLPHQATVTAPAEKQVGRPEIPAAQPERRIAKPALKPEPAQDFSGELERLHVQMDEIRALIVRSANSHTTAGRSVPELADVYARLMAAEVDPDLSKDIVDRLEAGMATDAFFIGQHDRGQHDRGQHGRGQQGQESVANRWKSMRFDAARLTAFVRAELERRVPGAPHLGS